eukprot:19557_1
MQRSNMAAERKRNDQEEFEDEKEEFEDNIWWSNFFIAGAVIVVIGFVGYYLYKKEIKIKGLKKEIEGFKKKLQLTESELRRMQKYYQKLKVSEIKDVKAITPTARVTMKMLNKTIEIIKKCDTLQQIQSEVAKAFGGNWSVFMRHTSKEYGLIGYGKHYMSFAVGKNHKILIFQ